LPTGVNPNERDYVQVTAIREASCGFELTLTQGLQHYHFGSTTTDWASHHNIDMRAQVFVLNRSIRIEG